MYHRNARATMNSRLELPASISGSDCRFFEGSSELFLYLLSVEIVHSAERYDPPIRDRIVDDTSLDSLQVEVVGVHKVHRADENHAMVETVEAVIVAIVDQRRDELVELFKADVFKDPRDSG